MASDKQRYRVWMRTTVLVEIDIDAESCGQAEKCALAWLPDPVVATMYMDDSLIEFEQSDEPELKVQIVGVDRKSQWVDRVELKSSLN